jgi:hypothetical protein
MVVIPPSSSARLGSHLMRLVALGALVALTALVLVPAAFAGQASTGELLFYPCTSCHPVSLIPGTDRPTKPLPNGFKGHAIVLEGHDKLGVGREACLACHDDPTRNPGMLKTVNGTLTDVKTGDIPAVCERCHSTKYKEFKAGTHGKHKPSCTSAGCHDPHTPQFIYASPLMPFVGTGFQFRVLPRRVAFRPLAMPAPDPATITPWWFVAVVVVAFVVAAVLVIRLVQGRSNQ